MSSPVFFDPTGRRSRISRRALAALLVVVVLAALAFATTLMMMPHRRELTLPFPHPHAAAARGEPHRHGMAAWLPRRGGAADRTPLSIGFYVPGDDASLASLRRNVAALDWVVPSLVNVAGPDHRFTVAADPAFARTMAALPHPPKVLPMVQNFGGDEWDGTGTARLLADPSARAMLTARLSAFVAQRHVAGLVMDVEALPASAMQPYLAFLRQLHAALPAGSILAAIGAASCCVIPFTLATVGISGAWIGNLTALAPYQPYFLGLAVVLLAGGFFAVYRKPRAACAEGSYCARPASGRFAKIALWSAAVLVVLAAAFPSAAPRLFDL